MQATRIIAVRHGETAWNVDTRIQGHIDIPLNDTGWWQARQLARALANEPIAAIYASDLQRAHATAQAVADATGAPLVADPGLRERSFGVEGATPVSVPQGIELRTEVGDLGSSNPQEAKIRFLPSGGASGGSIEVLRDHDVGTRLRVDWLSGRVTHEALAR